jgi:CheY-like chemotaxis protein
MKSPLTASVVVVGDDSDAVDAVVTDLTRHFRHVECASSLVEAQEKYEHFSTDVFVVAFKELAKAQPFSRSISDADHSISVQRSVLLCSPEDAAAALEMCKRRYFDDYVAYWPSPQDRSRLPMSVWLAGRAALALRHNDDIGVQLLTHAKELGELDRKVIQEIERGEKQAAATHDSMVDFEQKLAKANDDFSHRLVQPGADAAVEIKDSKALKRDLEHFKTHQLDLARAARDAVVSPLNDWAKQLRANVEPTLASQRTFAAKIREARPTLVVIVDDNTAKELLAPTLRFLGYDPFFVRGQKQMLAQLARTPPAAIVVDLMSATADVENLTRQLKARPELAHIPVIILSADCRRETLLRGIHAGAADFVAKPFTRDVLRAKLAKLLRQSDPA